MAMALMGMFMLVITDIVTISLDVQAESRATSSVAKDSRFILARLDYDISRSTAINLPTITGESGSGLELTIDSATYTYTETGGVLSLNTGSGPEALNSSDTILSNLVFQRLGDTSSQNIKVSFDLTSVNQTDQGQETRSFTSTFGRRL